MCSGQPAFAKAAARADGNRRLDDVVAGTQRVGGWVDERQNSFALVVMEHGPDKGGRASPRNEHANDDFPWQAGKKYDIKTGSTDQDCRPQIGLLGDQAKGDK